MLNLDKMIRKDDERTKRPIIKFIEEDKKRTIHGWDCIYVKDQKIDKNRKDNILNYMLTNKSIQKMDSDDFINRHIQKMDDDVKHVLYLEKYIDNLIYKENYILGFEKCIDGVLHRNEIF